MLWPNSSFELAIFELIMHFLALRQCEKCFCKIKILNKASYQISRVWTNRVGLYMVFALHRCFYALLGYNLRSWHHHAEPAGLFNINPALTIPGAYRICPIYLNPIYLSNLKVTNNFSCWAWVAVLEQGKRSTLRNLNGVIEKSTVPQEGRIVHLTHE